MPGFFSSLRLCTFAGINVYVHWSWFVVAYIEIVRRINPYSSIVWNIAEYVTLFGIVLLHEFGHALACRQVGGTADRIVLWPLGGAALVQPPPRPLATFWVIAAGPLVNLLLVPVTFGLLWSFDRTSARTMPDAFRFVWSITALNAGLLIFNMLPIYPLDGGRILQALLWPLLGRARSLSVVSFVGIVCGIGGAGVAIGLGNGWLIVLGGFMALAAVAGFIRAEHLSHPGTDALEQSGIDLGNGRYEQAAAQCDTALGQITEYPAARLTGLVRRGVARMALGDVAGARGDFDEAVEFQPLAEAYLGRAALSVSEGLYRDAIVDLSAALALKPKLAAALALRGLAHLRADDAVAAAADCTAALKLDANSYTALLVRSAAHGVQQQQDRATADYEAAIRLHPGALSDDPASPLFPLAAPAFCQMVVAAVPDVLAQATLAVGARPAAPTPSLNAAADDNCQTTAERIEQKLTRWVITALNGLIWLFPRSPWLRCERAYCFREVGDFASAFTDYDEALRLKPDHVSIRSDRAQAFVKQGNYERAIEENLAILSQEPDRHSVLNNLAHLWASCPRAEVRNGAKALEFATRACELTRWKNANMLDTLAAAYAEVGDFEQAVVWQKRALEYTMFSLEHGDQARARLQLYEKGEPYRATPPPTLAGNPVCAN